MQPPDPETHAAAELPGELSGARLHWYALASELAVGVDVLDIACGDGSGAAYLAPVARTVIGVDDDLRAVRRAAARHAALNLSFLAGNAVRIPLADQSVDLAVSFERLEGIAEDEQFIGELVRVLRPDGRLLIVARNKGSATERRVSSHPTRLRELYFDEFRDLLLDWFAQCRIYEQRPATAWAMRPLGGSRGTARVIGSGWDHGEGGLAEPARPEYFIAACALLETAAAPASLESVFVDPRDERIEPIPQPRASPETSAPPLTVADAGEIPSLASQTPAASVPMPETAAAASGSTERLERVAMLLARERNDLAAMLRSRSAVPEGDIAAALGETHGELTRTLEEMTSSRTRFGQAVGARNDASARPEST